ncbi:MAG: Transcriptional regulator MntR [Nitrosopumilus sp.]|nr:Transcriptional regulator MntR [Nitrosopumilus sp.]
MSSETLFVGTADAEHTEMYLKAIWHIQEQHNLVKVTSIAKLLRIREPSVVQMLKKLREKKLIIYNRHQVSFTESGRVIAKSMMRNSRLIEVLMRDTLKIKINKEIVCGIEHHMNKQFADALCTMLNHPRKCPHDKTIPAGICCK